MASCLSSGNVERYWVNSGEWFMVTSQATFSCVAYRSEDFPDVDLVLSPPENVSVEP